MKKKCLVCVCALLFISMLNGCFQKEKHVRITMFHDIISFQLPGSFHTYEDIRATSEIYYFEYESLGFEAGTSLLLIDNNDPYMNNSDYIENEIGNTVYQNGDILNKKISIWGLDVLYMKDVVNDRVVENYLFYQYPGKRYGVHVQYEDTEESKKMREEFLDSVEIKGIE